MTNQLTFYSDTAQGWEKTLMAFLAEKQRRSGSRRTVDSYSRMLQDFFGRLGKPPDEVASQRSSPGRTGRAPRGRSPRRSPRVRRESARSSDSTTGLIEQTEPDDSARIARLEANPYLPPGAKRHVRKLTPGRKRAFVSLIAEGASPTKAAKEIGVSRQACYRMRASDTAFAEEWDEALEMQDEIYEDALRTIECRRSDIRFEVSSW